MFWFQNMDSLTQNTECTWGKQSWSYSATCDLVVEIVIVFLISFLSGVLFLCINHSPMFFNLLLSMKKERRRLSRPMRNPNQQHHLHLPPLSCTTCYLALLHFAFLMSSGRFWDWGLAWCWVPGWQKGRGGLDHTDKSTVSTWGSLHLSCYGQGWWREGCYVDSWRHSDEETITCAKCKP